MKKVLCILVVLCFVGIAVADLVNVAEGKAASASSSTGWLSRGFPLIDGSDAGFAVDGRWEPYPTHDTSNHTNGAAPAWWEVDLGQDYDILWIDVYSNSDHSNGDILTVLDADRNVIGVPFDLTVNFSWNEFIGAGSGGYPGARYIRVENGDLSTYIVLTEVFAYADVIPEPASLLLLSAGGLLLRKKKA